ncbi:MAG: ABC transporter substrate-binding protein, partial [Janthinobacterium lividum]
MPTRRGVLTAAGAAMLAGSAAHAAGAPETRSVEIAGVRDPQLGAQMAIAQQYGYFKDAGLDVLIHWNQSAADTLTTMASGINVGVGGIFTQVVFSGQGLPIRTISALADIAETQGFALAPSVKLASPKELEGKKLAYTQGNSQILLIAKLADLYKF